MTQLKGKGTALLNYVFFLVQFDFETRAISCIQRGTRTNKIDFDDIAGYQSEVSQVVMYMYPVTAFLLYLSLSSSSSNVHVSCDCFPVVPLPLLLLLLLLTQRTV